jgi:hypothetical protein
VSRGVIGPEQVEPLWRALEERRTPRQSFDLPHVAYYLGALIVLLSVLLERRVFIVFGALGALGVSGYVGYLAYRVFRDSLLFPLVLTMIGIGVIFLGIQYQRHRLAIERTIQGYLPEGARRLLPPSRG